MFETSGHGVQRLAFMALLLMACDVQSPESPSTAATEPLAASGQEEAEAASPAQNPGTPPEACEIPFVREEEVVGSCSYINPFNQASECRDYHGGWSQEEVAAECGQVFTGVAGTLSAEPCPQSDLLGTCGARVVDSNYLAVLFYDGDVSQLASVCTQFLSGEFCAEGDDAAPTQLVDPLEDALQSMVSDDRVTVSPECLDDSCLLTLVEARQGISFSPAAEEPLAGLVFYPGAQVDPRAYAPVARRIALLGIKVVIVPMPGNLAITGIDRAKDVITPDIEHWFLGGHSMGGAMAVSFASLYQGDPELAGLVLWATYSDASSSLAETEIPVLSIAGSVDGVSTPEEIEAGKAYLPGSAEYYLLEGANHAQFGTYGSQAGDLNATMTASEQQQLSGALSAHFIKRIVGGLDLSDLPLVEDSQPAALCANGQRLFLGLDSTQEPELVQATEHVDMEAFEDSKPSLVMDGGSASIEVQVMTRPFGNGMLPEKAPIVPGEVWCKMKTREAFEAATGLQGGEGAPDCASLNQKAIDAATTALGTSSGFQVLVGEDNAYETGVEWIKEGEVLLQGDALQSPTLVVGDDQSLPEPFRNVIYCKLWSPSRALYYLITGH